MENLKTIKKTYDYVLNNREKIDDLSIYEDLVIEKDIDGEYCYYFAVDIEGINIQKLENAIIEKDKTGELCYWFASDIKGANIRKLEYAIIEKHKTGCWCYYFTKFISNKK
jgi:hypothetical protein